MRVLVTPLLLGICLLSLSLSVTAQDHGQQSRNSQALPCIDADNKVNRLCNGVGMQTQRAVESLLRSGDSEVSKVAHNAAALKGSEPEIARTVRELAVGILAALAAVVALFKSLLRKDREK